jgi:hypothetical protein
MVIGRIIWMKKGASSHLVHKHHIVYRVLAAIPCRPREPLPAVGANCARGQRSTSEALSRFSECCSLSPKTGGVLFTPIEGKGRALWDDSNVRGLERAPFV